MRTLLLALVLLSFTACKKDEKSVNGVYLVTGTEGTKTGSGTIEVNGTTMNINVSPVMVQSGITIQVNGSSLFAPQQTVGAIHVMSLSGSISPNSIAFSTKISKSGSVYVCNFNGSK